MTATVALAGVPNAGKTTLFNRLTGANQTVGNWPGQTVERHEGDLPMGNDHLTVVDLPGTYGLVAISLEEAIATSFLIDEHPEIVVTVIDATNLGTGLHLAVQIGEAGLRQIVALNMSDVAEKRGIHIDAPRLAATLRCPVVTTVARRGDGIGELRQAVITAVQDQRAAAPLIIDYGAMMERHLAPLMTRAAETDSLRGLGAPRWIALQLLAGDAHMTSVIGRREGGPAFIAACDQVARDIESETGHRIELTLAERRFLWITTLLERVARGGRGTTWSDRVDRVLTHRWLGLPVFILVMWVVLRFTADVTAPYLDWVDGTINGPLARWATALLGSVSLDGGWVESLVVDGVLTGVGGVLVFVPVLIGLYLMLAILEDSGYMARAAAVMDGTMRAIGIPGKAFLPMMVGFGCTVPAIYATRCLESSRDRLLTGLLTPFMSCGARLPVYVLLAGVFFAGSRGSVVFAMYLVGIVVAILLGWLLSRTVLREQESSSLVMVMPSFRLPNARTVWALVHRRTGSFLRGAGTTIFVASIAVWLLLAVPISGGGSFADTEPEESLFGGVSRLIAPVYAPAGFDEWEQSGSLITGFVAKEVVVATMAQLYAVNEAEDGIGTASGGFFGDLRDIGTSFIAATGDTVMAVPGVVGIDFLDLDDESSPDLHTAIARSFDESSDGHPHAAGLAFMVFVLLYTPCMAAAAAFRQEFGTRWMWVSVGGQFVVAWVGAVITFQGARLLGMA